MNHSPQSEIAPMSVTHIYAERNPPVKLTVKERGEKRLQTALKWAKGGFNVFPLAANSKLPLKGSKGFKDATRDPDKIRDLFARASICNIGIRCDQFEGRPIIVLDEDGPEAVAQIAAWEAEHGALPETLSSITRKGRHRFFFVSEPIKGSIRKAGIEIDFKGFDGYVVAPGSTVKGDDGAVHEYAFEKPCEIATAPEWFEAIAREAAGVINKIEKPSAAGQVLSGIDHERAESRAIEWLKQQPETPPGIRNDTGFKIAAALKDFGCDETTTVALMVEHWKVGGVDIEDVEELARNAFKYGKEPQGANAPEAVFSAYQAEGVTDAPEKAKDAFSAPIGGKFVFDGYAPSRPLPALVKRLLPKQGVVFIGGPSGAGKSFVAVDLGLRVASGLAFFGHKVTERVGVAFIAAEGAATIARRLEAAKRAAEIDAKPLPFAWVDNVPDLSAAAGMVWLAEELESLIAKLQSDHGVRLGMVIIDTLGAAFSMKDENSNAEANAIIRDLRTITEKTGAVVVAVHHYGKSAETGLRGASAYRGGADAVLSVMANRSETTGEVSNRRIALAKSRVGEEGPISGFTLEEMKLGVDEDLEDYGSCYVKACDGEEDAEARRLAKPLKDGEQLYLQAMAVVGKAASADEVFNAAGPVSRELIRVEFYSRYPVDDESDADKQDTKSKAFRRYESYLKKRGMIDMRETPEGMMVWRLN